MTRKRLVIILSLILAASAVWCFYEAVQYFDAGIMYVAETSSNPQPSERAKIMGPLLMDKSRAWFIGGLSCVTVLVVLLVINWAASNKRLQPTPR